MAAAGARDAVVGLRAGPFVSGAIAGSGLIGIDSYDHDAVDLDQESHGRLVGCRSKPDRTMEGCDFILRRRSGDKR